jgi:hypothetical protein
VYIRYFWQENGREITEYTVTYGVYIRFWPTHILSRFLVCPCPLSRLSLMLDYLHTSLCVIVIVCVCVCVVCVCVWLLLFSFPILPRTMAVCACVCGELTPTHTRKHMDARVEKRAHAYMHRWMSCFLTSALSHTFSTLPPS